MKNFQQKLVGKDEKSRELKVPSVTEYMTKNLITFKEDTQINVAIDTLLEKRITGAPVLNDRDEVVGLIDDKDCLRVLFGSAYYNQPSDVGTVSNYMSNVMKSISEHDDLLDVATIFMNTPFKRLLVMNDAGKLIGQISRRDVLTAIKELNSNTW